MTLREQYLRRERVANVPMFTPSKLSAEFGDTQKDQTLNNCVKIFTVADILKFVDVWHLSVALEVLFAFSQVFGDVNVSEPVEEPEGDNT